MDNIKEYIVKYKPNRIPIVTGLQQWDYGQHLIIQGIPLDELYETNVYFCFADSLKCFPSKNAIFEENEINVQIPKFIFQKQIENCCYNEYKAYAFVYLKNGEYGKTIYKIALEIEVMPKPDEYEYDEEKLYFEELTSMLEMKADGLKYINNVLYLLAGEHILSKVTIKSGSGGGSGTDGKEVELRNDGTYIQWRYVGDEEWINLVSLEVLKGDNGITPHIGNNGNWFIGETDTGVKAEGTNGYTPQKGKDYFDGYSPIAKVLRTEQNSVYIEITDKEGKTEAFVYDGKNGITPHIGDNGNWYLGEEDTNVKAQGIDGRGIKSLEKTSSTGNIDTYTMTYTDGTKFMYNVVNASNESGGIVAETDPTVPSWAKQPTKPSYTAQEVGALPDTTKIPTNTSDLNNDNEFITKTVTDLVNYYTKSQSYSKDEIDNKLSAIPKFSIQPVEQLPITNISETTVYLLKTGDEENNLYTEYIYVDNKWEYLGKQTIDLSGYALKTEIPTRLSSLTNDVGFITNTVSNLVNYYSKGETYSKSEIDAKGYLTEHQDLSDYAKKSEVPKNLSQLNQDSTHRVVTDSQVETWNNKSNFSGNYNDLTNKPTIPSKTSQLANDSNFAKKEDIPTELPASDVYSWAKKPQKPAYSASEVGALPNTTEIPEKTSDLTNDSGFITKAVNDLANYYLKSQTYSAKEIDNKISTIPKFSIEVVTSLPTTNISNTTVYLIASGNEQDNLYTEYIYVNGKWEYLGKQTVDLSGYVKRTELSSYYTKTEIDSLLQTIRNSIPTKLSQMTEDSTHRTVTDTEKSTWNAKSNFSGIYDDLTNKPNIPSLTGYAKESYVQEYAQPKGDYATNEKVGKLEKTIADQQTEINNKQPKGDYALKSELTAETTAREQAVASINARLGQQTVCVAEGETQEEAEVWLEANGDKTKLYLMPDETFWQYKKTTEVVEGGANYTNLIDGSNGYIKKGYRYSASSSAFKAHTSTNGDFASIVIPVPTSGELTIRVRGMKYTGDYPTIYGGTTNSAFTNCFADKTTTKTYDNNGDWMFSLSNTANVSYIVTSGVLTDDATNIIATVNEEIVESDTTTVIVEKWSSTGHGLVATNYDEIIATLTNIVNVHTEEIGALKDSIETGLTDKEKLTAIKNWDMPIYDTNIPLFELATEKSAINKNTELTIESVYAKYDALMGRNPDFITKTKLGLASDNTTPIYRYDFRAYEPRKEGGKVWSETKAKAIIITGIHGEWGGIYAMYNALEEITENPDLYEFRRNIHLIVIPATNPNGLLNSGVKNFNGVEIHRNFEVDFLYPTDSGYIPEGELHYGGTEPLSEVETQYIDDIMKNNTDSAFFLSCHSYQYDSYWGTSFIWSSTATKYMCNLGYRLVDKMSNAWMNKYSEILEQGFAEYKTDKVEDGDYRMGYAGLSTSAGTEAKQATKYGIQGTNLEIADTFQLHGTKANPETSLSSFTISRGAEVYVNFLLTAFGVYDYKDKEQYYK